MHKLRTAGLVLGSVLATLGATLALALPRPQAVAGQEAAATCSFPFHAEVYRGPNTGLAVAGVLTLDIEPSGSTSGALVQDGGAQLPLVGQTTGRAINLLFDLGDGTHLSGVGTADSDIRACQFHTILGPFIGPKDDDSGAWAKFCPLEVCKDSPAMLSVAPTGE